MLGWGSLLTTYVRPGASHADLASAFEASPNPYLLLTPDLHIAEVNQAYVDVTGARRDDIIGAPLFQTFDAGPSADAPENVRQVKASLEKARDTRQRDHLAVVRFAIPRLADDGREVFDERIWSATHTPLMNAEGEVVYLLQHTMDITELSPTIRADEPTTALDALVGGAVLRRAQSVQEDNRRLEIERNRLVEMFMQAPGFVAVLSGPEHRFQMHNHAYTQLIGRQDIAGKSFREALPDLAQQGYFEMLDQVYQTGQAYEGREARVQLQRHPGAEPETVYLNFICQPIRDESGTVAGIFVQGYDVTETVRSVHIQKLMIDELNHRVKNTLATVQSIAIQTARAHADPATFAATFQSRILALSHTHDLLTRSHWEGADLQAMLSHETEPFGSSRISLNGPSTALPPATALSLGMIFHELATNAAKYGALSEADGRIFIDWTIDREAGRTLKLVWRESGGPKVSEPSKKGFGNRLIERNIRHDLAGTISLDYAPDGLIAELTVPLDRTPAE